jgi:hypothetical protein
MTTQRDLERALDAFFAEGSDEVADRVIDDALLTIDHTRQRRVLSAPWRFFPMIPFARTATAVVAVAVLIGGAAYLLAPGGQVGGPAPTTSPASPTDSPSPSPLTSALETIDPATWVAYTSERYGYTLEHPADWTIEPSQSDWGPGTIHSETSTWADEISDPQGGDTAGGYSIFAGRQDLEAGQTPESWTAQYINNKELDAGGVCGDISADQYEPVEINGETGQRIEMVCAGATFYTAAIVVHDGSAYLVAVATESSSRDALAVELFDAVLASFRFAAS